MQANYSPLPKNLIIIGVPKKREGISNIRTCVSRVSPEFAYLLDVHRFIEALCSVTRHDELSRSIYNDITQHSPSNVQHELG
jgi:hypothetical protein